jgi:hypothetical protein
MNCSSVDVKAYALGEPSGVPGEAAHIESCEHCREELQRLRLMQTALLSLKEEEIPQRIAFVSDKVFEPRWWQRIWHSGPAMGFASAALLATAIFVHAATRPAPVVQATTVNTAQIEQQIRAEVNKRVDAAVTGAVGKVVADSQAREAKATQLLDAASKRFEMQRRSDIAMMEQSARYYENKVGQLMVASNSNYGGAR